jgi:hypothetical protein
MDTGTVESQVYKSSLYNKHSKLFDGTLVVTQVNPSILMLIPPLLLTALEHILMKLFKNELDRLISLWSLRISGPIGVDFWQLSYTIKGRYSSLNFRFQSSQQSSYNPRSF